MAGLLFLACHPRKGDEDAFLFKIGDTGVSVAQFRRALELEQPNALSDQGDGDLETVLTFLNQMIEERLIMARAAELGIVIEEATLAAAVAAVKADYPDDTFEETLLESAVSFNQWREQLRRRLLLEKVVNQELAEQVEIAPEDVAAYYAENYANRRAENTREPMTAESINAAIVTHLRRTKAQERYPAWIQSLQERYGLVVDWERWHQLTEKLLPATSPAAGGGMRLVSPPAAEAP
jgi:hypothetical protein